MRGGIAAGALLLAAASYFSLAVGVVGLSPLALVRPGDADLEILIQSRLPRLAAVLLAGASLAVAGLLMQRLTHNRFVSPTTAGTVEASVLGLLITIWLLPGASLVTRMLFAIACAIVATIVFLQLLQRLAVSDGLMVALVGLMYGGVISAVATFFALRNDLMQFLDVWTSGSFSGVLAGRYEPLYIVAAVSVAVYLFADRFTVVGMGREMSVNLGVNYHRWLYAGLILVSLVAAVVTSVVGALPFLGLIVPNIVTLFMGDNMRAALPVTALVGAAFVLVCDVAGRVIRFPYEIPASVIAGVIGGAVFIWLIVRATDRSAVA